MAIHFEAFSSVEAIDRNLWNELAASAGPSMEWEYFYALERSGSVSVARGYKPRHLIAYRDGRPVALAPLYERDRAWVEFGDGGLIEFLTELTGLPFDHGLVGTIPFTPIPGYQFLHDAGENDVEIYEMLLNYIDFICESKGFSSARIYFVALDAPRLHAVLSQHEYICLKGEYCLWFNRGYKSFDDYLNSFRSARRTKIKRELRTISDFGIDIKMLSGNDVPLSLYDSMYQVYVRTWIKHMGTEIRPFLNQDFFRLLGRFFPHRCSFSIASRSSQDIAMALFYHKAASIHGRYWGSFEDVPFLHFATCYYYPIMHAIERGIGTVDPGFGGEHKLIRGYETVPVYHYLKFYGKQQRKIASTILERMKPMTTETGR
jgi:predicted N-acyltransferase